jgi:hypothetical protein
LKYVGAFTRKTRDEGTIRNINGHDYDVWILPMLTRVLCLPIGRVHSCENANEDLGSVRVGSVPVAAELGVHQTLLNYVPFEGFTAVSMKNGVFWDVTTCGSCMNRSFGGTYHLHDQGNNNRRARNNDISN